MKLNSDFIRTHVCKIKSPEHYLTRPHILYDECLRDMSNCLIWIEKASRGNIAKNLLRKLQLLSPGFNYEQFIQDSCEITLAGHFAKEYVQNFAYEKRSTGKKNVDFSFYLADQNINVEVKCPTPTNSEIDTVQVQFFDRIENRKKLMDGINKSLHKSGNIATERKREELKLKDYLKSASAKFEQIHPDEINILSICCDDEMHVQEYRNYLMRTRQWSIDPPFEYKDFTLINYIHLTNLGHRHRAIYSSDFCLQESPWNAARALNLLYKIQGDIIVPATGNIAKAFSSKAEDFEKLVKTGQLIPQSEDALFLPFLGIAWFSDELRTHGFNQFSRKHLAKRSPHHTAKI